MRSIHELFARTKRKGKKPRLEELADESPFAFSLKPYFSSQDWQAVYEEQFAIRDAVDMTAEFAARPSVRIKWRNDPIEDLEKNLIDMLDDLEFDTFLSYAVRRYVVDGCFGAEIVRDKDKLPVALVPLRAEGLDFVTDKHKLSGFDYKPLKGEKIEYKREDVFYVPRNPFKKPYIGCSALSALESPLEHLEELIDDIKELGSKLWKRSILYEVDDSELTTEESSILFNYLTNLDPGKSLAVNQMVKANELKTGGDMAGLLEAKREASSDIAVNFGIPRVMWGATKSADIGTLRPALVVFYEVKIKPIQKAFAAEITRRLFDPYISRQTDDSRAKAYFASLSLQDFTDLTNALTKLLETEVINENEVRDIIGLGTAEQ